LYRLYQLRKLTLSNNMIEWISPDIAHLVHLQELNVSRNGMLLLSASVTLQQGSEYCCIGIAIN